MNGVMSFRLTSPFRGSDSKLAGDVVRELEEVVGGLGLGDTAKAALDHRVSAPPGWVLVRANSLLKKPR